MTLSYMYNIIYCLYTIFKKLHFSKSHFSETPQEKYDHVVFLQPKSRKKCRKNFKIENQANLRKNLRAWCSAMHTIQFCFGLVHLNEITISDLFPENSYFPYNRKRPTQLIFRHYFLFLNRCSNFLWHFLMLMECKRVTW